MAEPSGNNRAGGCGSALGPIPPTLVLISADDGLSRFVTGKVKPPWNISAYRPTEMVRPMFTDPNVQLVVFDDEAIDASLRGMLLGRIRRLTGGGALLYVAGSHSDQTERQARANGAHYYVSKPIEFEGFSRVLESFLRIRK